VKTLARLEDVRYFHARAEQEILHAQTAQHPAAVRAHYLLASLYLDLVHASPLAPPRPLNALQH
jgi:hypothetical protein